MQLTILHGYPDAIGRRKFIVAFGNGPASYTQYNSATGAGGDPLTGLPYQWYSDDVSSGIISVSGNYIAMSVSTGVGARQAWKLRYFAFSSSGIGSEVSASTNLSAEKFQISIIGGLY